MYLKSARPIPNSEVIEFIEKNITSQYLYSDHIVKTFLNTYFAWIQESKLNKLHGLKKFDKLSYVHGTSQSFDFFYAENKDRRMRCFKGDFIYHQLSWRNNYPNWKFLEDDVVDRNDAVIISVPFSDFGSEHSQTQKILNTCDELNVPVFIDCAYYSIARGIDFNLDRPCIKAVAFSLSKAFYGTERLRIGMRCKKEFNDDPVDVFNGVDMVSRLGAGVGYALCTSFGTDYNQNKFRKKQLEICEKSGIIPSDCVIFGLAEKDHKLFHDYNRGTDWRRVCISKILADIEGLE
jgi:hypothetical protein